MAYGSLTSATAFITLKAVDQTATGINTATGRIRAMAAKLDAMGNAMIFKGMATLAPAMAGLVLPSRAINQWSEFERAMLTVQVKSKGTREEYEKLIQTTRKYARESSWTAQEVAKTQAAMASGSNFSMQEIGDTFEAVLDYARAAGQDNPEEAARHMMAAMNVFGLRTKESATDAADWMTAAVNNSQNLDMDLGYALQNMGAGVAVAGGTLQDALAMLMTIGQQGMVGSKAGTSMKQFLLQTQKEAKKLDTQYGIKIYDESGKRKSIQQRISDIVAKRNEFIAAGNDEALDKFDLTIFKTRTSEGVKMLLKDLMAIAENYGRLEASAGEARNTREHMESGMFGSIKRIQSAWQDLMLSVGQSFGKAMQNVEGFIIPILNSLSDWVQKHGAIVRLATEILVALLAIGAGLIIGGLALKIIGVSMAAICGMTQFLLTALGLIVVVLYGAVLRALMLIVNAIMLATTFMGALALLGVAAAGIFLYGVFQVTRLGEVFGSTFSGVFALLTNGEFRAAWDLLCRGFGLAWAQLCNGMKLMFWEVMDVVVQKITWLVRKINDVSEWSGVGRWEALDNFDKGANQWSQNKVDHYIQKGTELLSELDDLKKDVEEIKKPWMPEDVEDKTAPFTMPAPKIGEAISKLSGRGVGGAGALLEAVQSDTMAGWKKFQENMRNGALEGIGKDVGDIRETLGEISDKLDGLEAEAL